MTETTLRMAVPQDARAIATVHVRSWQAAYRGLLPDDFLDGLRVEERMERYTFDGEWPTAPLTFVATRDGAICGFATVGPSRDTDRQGEGEIYALYVEPSQWSNGVGRILLAESCRALLERGFDRAVLWVLAGNDRAERFYRSAGWRREGSKRDEDVWGVDAHVVRFEKHVATAG